MGRRGKAVVLLARGSEEEYIGTLHIPPQPLFALSIETVCDVEFLKLRKIPLTKHRYLDQSDVLGAESAEPKLIRDGVDPKAFELLEEIRDILVRDRAINDKVSP
jgi:ATP-dependent RNA helicase DDX55/SPB4